MMAASSLVTSCFSSKEEQYCLAITTKGDRCCEVWEIVVVVVEEEEEDNEEEEEEEEGPFFQLRWQKDYGDDEIISCLLSIPPPPLPCRGGSSNGKRIPLGEQ